MKIVCTAEEFVTVTQGAKPDYLREATAEDIALALTGQSDMDAVVRRKYLEVARTLNRILKVTTK